MVIKIQIKSGKNLSEKEMNLMNDARIREFGKDESKNFKKDYPLTTKYFFVMDKKDILAFGLLRPIRISYLGKNYSILGICSIISIKKIRGFGKILIQSMIEYLKKTGKTGLGFTVKPEFFRKSGLKVKKYFIKKFIYENPLTKEKIIDEEGDGIYYNGKDNFIKNVLSNKSKVHTNIAHW